MVLAVVAVRFFEVFTLLIGARDTERDRQTDRDGETWREGETDRQTDRDTEIY